MNICLTSTILSALGTSTRVLSFCLPLAPEYVQTSIRAVDWCLNFAYNTPLVLGTSLPPVRLIASRIASASALNADSDLPHGKTEIGNSVACMMYELSSPIQQIKKKQMERRRTCDDHYRPSNSQHEASLQRPWQTSGKHEESSPSRGHRSFPVSAPNQPHSMVARRCR